MQLVIFREEGIGSLLRGVKVEVHKVLAREGGVRGLHQSVRERGSHAVLSQAALCRAAGRRR